MRPLRYFRFSLRTLMVLVTLVAISCGLLVERWRTVQRFNKAYDRLQSATIEIFFSNHVAPPTFSSASHRSRMLSSGEFRFSATDDQTYCIGMKCVSSSFLFGKPELRITMTDAFGPRPLNAELNRELRQAIIDRLPKENIRILIDEN